MNKKSCWVGVQRWCVGDIPEEAGARGKAAQDPECWAQRSGLPCGWLEAIEGFGTVV